MHSPVRPQVRAPGRSTTVILVSAWLLLAAFAFQGTRALWEPEEGRYTAVALQMLDSGDWLLPRLNDEQIHLTKPPLTYWALAASVATFGRTAWAARLPAALAFVATGLLVLGLARSYLPERPWLGVAVWSGSLLPLLAANVVNTDPLLAFWETLAVSAFVAQAGSDRERRWLVLMWAGFALGFLTKGPPALLPLAAILAWTALSGGRDAVRRLFPPAGLLLFATLGLGWYLAMAIQDPKLVGHFLGHEVFERVFTDHHHRNGQWYGALVIYLPVLLVAALPWLPLVRCQPGALAGLASPAAWRRRLDTDPLGSLLLLWLLLPLAVFVLARSRMYLYLLPLAVPLSLLLAREVSARIDRSPDRRWHARVVAWLALALLAKGALAHLPSAKDAAAEAARLAPWLEGVDRIVFVGERAHYGLRFYTGLPVEYAAAAATGGDGGIAARLCEQAADHPRALFIGPRQGASAARPCPAGRLLALADNVWRGDPPARALPSPPRNRQWTVKASP